MNESLRVVGIGVISVFCIILLREAGFRGTKLVSSVAMVGISSVALVLAGQIVSGLGMDGLDAGGGEILRLFIKIMGVGYVFGIGTDICRELGEGGVANALLGVGRVEILLICMPAFSEIFELGLSYLQ